VGDGAIDDNRLTVGRIENAAAIAGSAIAAIAAVTAESESAAIAAIAAGAAGDKIPEESAICRRQCSGAIENRSAAGCASWSAARAVGFARAGFAVSAIRAAGAIAVECAEQKGEISTFVINAATETGARRPVGPVGTEARAIAAVATTCAADTIAGKRAIVSDDCSGRCVVDRAAPAAATEAGSAIGAAGTAVLTADKRQIHQSALDSGINREKTDEISPANGQGLAGSIQNGIL